MGTWFSSASPHPRTAKVVHADGSLREYSSFVTVSDALGSHFPSNFLCNSDSLAYNTHIPVLHLDVPLRLGQLYFVLPVEILGRLLTGQDMAALAAKALSALNSASGKRFHRRRRKYQVVPMAMLVDEVEEDNQKLTTILFRPAASGPCTVKLSTIQEIAE